MRAASRVGRDVDEDRHLATAATKTSEPAFAAIWDNDDEFTFRRWSQPDLNRSGLSSV
jgi:hypothetical protein